MSFDADRQYEGRKTTASISEKTTASISEERWRIKLNFLYQDSVQHLYKPLHLPLSLSLEILAAFFSFSSCSYSSRGSCLELF